jgi:hypothetical protein
MTAAKLRLAMASMGQPETKVGDLCEELGITRQTLYRHVSPKGELRPDGVKLLSSVQPHKWRRPGTGRCSVRQRSDYRCRPRAAVELLGKLSFNT